MCLSHDNIIIMTNNLPKKNPLYIEYNPQCFKDTKGIFTKIWTIVVDYVLQCMVAVKNDVYGWSDEVKKTITQYFNIVSCTLKQYRISQ